MLVVSGDRAPLEHSLAIASPTPKDNGDFTEQSWGKYIDFTFISCTSPWEINKNLQLHTSIPGVGSGGSQLTMMSDVKPSWRLCPG